MRHRNKKSLGLGKTRNKRLLRQMASSLILHERVELTAASGKIVQSFVEKLITKGKAETLHSKRQIFSDLPDNAARKVFEVLSPKYKDRKGGYTRAIRVKPGKDGNPKLLIEFV